VKNIFGYSAEEGTNLQFSKDFWNFTYLSNGMNVLDICSLKCSQIDDNVLTYSREKTKNTKEL
jgi:hypothetical protein